MSGLATASRLFPPRSGLSRSDLVRWPDPEVPTAGPAGPLILMSSVKHRTHD